ncbi:MAG: menaquinol-cytochrome C reductase [Verrucomicrobiales bacterium]|nr:menaquinol-cytochrome C reductase [Verrucomicrobiales bacterium]|tara:strand:- start:14009 stop:15814 length:1806 start_codon:yes stop_codon:yes gene_type:complete
MKKLFDWLDDRTGYRKITKEALYEPIPGGARWRYIWGSTLTFAIAVQFITGMFLWMAYSPSAQTAWESVYYIQHEMKGGWILRGIHHWTAQAMTILLVLHLMQVLIDGAYKAPRELNFWTGLILLQLVLGLSLTGYLLPWDQKGYWATKVATNLMGLVPWVGDDLQRLVVGGSDYGHHTLTRFFALHAGVLPMGIIALIGAHIYFFRKQGIHTKKPHKKKDGMFWPDQVLMDAVACLAVLITVLVFVRMFHGAHLSAPANPAESFPARPDWYFLFLFQFLKYFEGGREILGAIIIPGAVMTFMFVMPFLGGWKLGHRFNVFFIVVLLVGAGYLTWEAMDADKRNPEYQAALVQSDKDSHRVVELARGLGIPPEGAVTLLVNDPKTQGPKLFAQNCASCHRYDGHDGLGNEPADPQSAPDLLGVGSREWLTRFLNPEHIGTTNFFGNTAFKNGQMVKWVNRKLKNHFKNESEMTDDELDDREELNQVIFAISAEAQLHYQAEVDAADFPDADDRKDLIFDSACIDCHNYEDEYEPGETDGPDLTGYGSRQWLTELISNPANPKHYGENNDRMPAFGEKQMLTEPQIGVLVSWLRQEWYEPGR